MQRAEEAGKLAAEARAVRTKKLAAAVEPAVDLGKVYETEPGLRRPELVERTEPDYAEEARIAQHQGTVQVEVVVDADGVPRNAKVLQILGLGLDEKALDAVKNWRFRPAKIDGKKVPCRVVLAIDFSLI